MRFGHSGTASWSHAVVPEDPRMNGTTSSPAGLPVHAIASQIAAGRLSPVDLVDDCLARIERLDPKLLAFVDVYAADARLGTVNQTGSEI